MLPENENKSISLEIENHKMLSAIHQEILDKKDKYKQDRETALDENNEVEVRHWSKMKGNKFDKAKLRASMLKPGGIKLLTLCGLTGEKGNVPWKYRWIVYDSDFFFSKMQTQFENPLNEFTKDEFLDCMAECYKRFKKE